MAQNLMAMLPADVRDALDGGASPAEVAQSLLAQRLQERDDVVPVVPAELEEPWPALGWGDATEPAAAARPARGEHSYVTSPVYEPDGRLADLARALGACSLCLGDRPECPLCSGDGSPGWTVPQPDLFCAFVVPALRRLDAEDLRRAQAATARFASPPPRHNGHFQQTTSQEEA